MRNYSDKLFFNTKMKKKKIKNTKSNMKFFNKKK